MTNCASLPNAAELVEETRLSAEYIARLNGGEAKDYIPWKAADVLEQAVKQNAGMVKRCDELIAENEKLQQTVDVLTEKTIRLRADRDAAVNATKWISVKDRLPESKTRNLVLRYDPLCDEHFCDIFWYEKGAWWNRKYCGDFDVTHWMPLPEAPEEESFAE